MKTLDRDHRVVEIARSFGVPEGSDVVNAIVRSCRERVECWTRQAGGVQSVHEVQELLCSRLNLRFEEFHGDAELQKIVRRYVDAGEAVFASLPMLFDDDTFATLIRRRTAAAEGTEHFVAVIDCRGTKRHRRFFSRWHEIAHLLTLATPTVAQPVHRSTSRGSAVEQLMDLIAAEIGFFDDLFGPLFAAETASAGRLDFATVDRVRARLAPAASFQATAIACLKRWPRPAAYLEATLAWTKAESRIFDEERVPAHRPTPKLRVVKAVGNEASKQTGLRLLTHMQVPESSVIHRAFFSWGAPTADSPLASAEDLIDWRRSNGGRLPRCPIRVEVRPGRHHVQALLQFH